MRSIYENPRTRNGRDFHINPHVCGRITTMHENLYMSACYGDFLINKSVE